MSATLPISAPRQALSRWEKVVGPVDSPIERIMLDSFCSQAVDPWGYAISGIPKRDNGTIVVRPQKQIGNYRVDLLIEFMFHGKLLQVVVECDGHEFHERNKAQVKRDKQRDRAITKEGYRLFRFSGSEIYLEPARSSFEVLDEIMRFQTAVIESAMKEAAGGKN